MQSSIACCWQQSATLFNELWKQKLTTVRVATQYARPSLPSVGAEAPRAAEPTAT